MDKSALEQKIKELLVLKEKVENKKREVDNAIIEKRSQLYKILEEERANTPPPDVSFLSDEGWG
jgi:hypothetical protein